MLGFVHCNYKTQGPRENDSGIGNEGSGFQSNSKVWESVKCPIDVHISLRMK